MCNIGFVGAQRVGKTTTAQRVADYLGLPFIKTDVGGVWTKLGLDPKASYPIGQRIQIQLEILNYLTEHLESEAEKGYFVTDRTPLDVLGYMQADILRDFPVEHTALMQDFYNKCKESHNRIFESGLSVLIQPGIPPSEADTSAAFCLPYMWHLTALYKSYLVAMDDSDYMPYMEGSIVISKDMLDLNQRVQFVVDTARYVLPI